jgi:hypothetical protein
MKSSNPIQQLLANPATFTTALMAIILEHYGTEALEWTPETIFMELRDDFHVDLPKQNKDQIVAGINLLTSDDFYTRPSMFVQICNVLAGSEMAESFDKADVVECAWGIAEAYLISPPQDLQHAFHPEILHYLGSVLDDEGIKKPPAILNIALRDSDWSDKSEYETIPTDDTIFFAASYGNREERTSQIEQVLSENLSLLFSQLASIPGFEKGVSELAEGLQSAG